MRRGEAEDAPAFLPCARGRRGSWKCPPRTVTALGEGGRAGSEQPSVTAQFLLKPVGFCSCHRHRSSPGTGGGR